MGRRRQLPLNTSALSRERSAQARARVCPPYRPKRDMPAAYEDVPWRSCPWLLERTNVRALDPPLWCYDLGELGQRDCEAAYVTNVLKDETTYQRCMWNPNTRACSSDREKCTITASTGASSTGQRVSQTTVTTAASHHSLASPPPPLPPPRKAIKRATPPPPPPLPAPSPAPPLESLRKIQPIDAAISSRFHETLYAASSCIDGDIRSLCATNRQPEAWASVKLPAGSTVDLVVVHNRADDNKEYLSWLSPFEVWLGRSYGDTADERGAVQCGGGPIRVPAESGPFTVSCGGARGSFVTVVLVGSRARWLTIAEISVYGSPGSSQPRPAAAQIAKASATPTSPSPTHVSHEKAATSPRGTPKSQRDPRCQSANAKEAHQLGVPKVTDLSCSALVLELPPLPPDHCDEDPNQRLSVESRHGLDLPGSEWHEVKHNVLSPTVFLGGLDASQAYEFRMVLHRPTLGDRHSESSGLVVVDDSDNGNSTGLRTAPLVRADNRGGEHALVISWDKGAGVCRKGQGFTLQAADAGKRGADGSWPGLHALTWRTIAQNVTSGRKTLRVDAALREFCSASCTFRLVPLDVEGWMEATKASAPVAVWQHGRSAALSLFMFAIFFTQLIVAVMAFAAAYAAYKEPSLRDLRDPQSRMRLWEAVRVVLLDGIATLVVGAQELRSRMPSTESVVQHARESTTWLSQHARENAAWLSRAWLDGLGAYRRAARDDDGDGEDEGALREWRAVLRDIPSRLMDAIRSDRSGVAAQELERDDDLGDLPEHEPPAEPPAGTRVAPETEDPSPEDSNVDSLECPDGEGEVKMY